MRWIRDDSGEHWALLHFASGLCLKLEAHAPLIPMDEHNSTDL